MRKPELKEMIESHLGESIAPLAETLLGVISNAAGRALRDGIQAGVIEGRIIELNDDLVNLQMGRYNQPFEQLSLDASEYLHRMRYFTSYRKKALANYSREVQKEILNFGTWESFNELHKNLCYHLALLKPWGERQ